MSVARASWGLLATTALCLLLAMTADPWLSTSLRLLEPTALGSILRWIGHAGAIELLLILAGAFGLAAVLAWYQPLRLGGRARACCSRSAWTVGFILAAVATSGLPCAMLKLVVGRSRPKPLEDGVYTVLPFLIDADYFSFPSGHVNTAMAAMVSLGFFFPKWRWALWLIGVLVGLSRVIDGAHYPGDVLFGGMLAIFMTLYLRYYFARSCLIFTGTGAVDIQRFPATLWEGLQLLAAGVAAGKRLTRRG